MVPVCPKTDQMMPGATEKAIFEAEIQNLVCAQILAISNQDRLFMSFVMLQPSSKVNFKS
ncbi:hypothetical protein Plhal304r1_c034g0106081 [Plasmopara halstedii]